MQIEEKTISIRGEWVNGLPKLNHKFDLKQGNQTGSITFVENNEEQADMDVNQLNLDSTEENYFKSD